MILITGGAFQGKGSFAFRLAGIEEGQGSDRVADGKSSCFEKAYESLVILDFHEYVKRLLEDGMNPEAFVMKILEKNPQAVVVADELGCGIVPVEKKERLYRETAGRMAALLAGSAQEVYRMVCGIPVRIK